MISHTLTSVQKPCQLQNYIDNRDSTKTIGLKSHTGLAGIMSQANNIYQSKTKRMSSNLAYIILMT